MRGTTRMSHRMTGTTHWTTRRTTEHGGAA